MKRLRFQHYDGDEYTMQTAYLRGKTWVMLAAWTQSCSGCCELGDYGSGSDRYGYDDKAHCLLGFGCEECGYTGKRRMEFYVPISKDEQIVLNTRMQIRKALGNWIPPDLPPATPKCSAAMETDGARKSNELDGK